MNTVLITGSSGFIGQALTRRWEADGVEVVPFDVTQGFEVDQFDDVARAIRRRSPEVMVHLAAVTTTSQAGADPHRCHRVNILGTLHVLEAARQAGVRRVLVASTDQVHLCRGLSAADTYSASKACADLVAMDYARDPGMTVTVLRHCNVYGPGDTSASRLIPGTIQRVLRGEAPVVRGQVERAFIYIDDLVEIYVRLAREEARGSREIRGGPVRPGGGSGPVTINAVVDLLLAEMKSSLRVVREAGASVPMAEMPAGAEVITGGTPLREGLARTVRWWMGTGKS